MAIHTPAPTQKSNDLFGLRARAALHAEVAELRQTVLALTYRIERMERREQERQRLERMKPKIQHTQYFPTINPSVPVAPSEQIDESITRRITRPLGDIDQWTTVSEIPSVKLPTVQPTRLDVQVAQAASGHFDLYARHANVAYLNARNLETLAKDCGIRDLLWGEQLIELRCDETLTDDQILCVTEENEYGEITQKKPVVHAHVPAASAQ